METTLTISVQDYLKAIYELTAGGEPANTTALATRLGIAPASVTGMIQKLSRIKPPLVEYRKHQGVKLTAQGNKAALEVIRHHRLIEAWLVQTLGYSWDEVHAEAEQLEHAISEDFEARIASALGNPERDPHGEPIPSVNLTMPEDTLLPLAALRKGQAAIVKRVNAENPELLRHLDSLGLVPGTKIEITDYSPYDNNLTVLIDDQDFVIGLAISTKIFVEKF
ncbi:MAG: hypothetical protein A2Y54_01630 [Chloroflexi bacterium RBG_16_51_16]|nr:MAG: hypothetical protein A2Y54_01630 [Chloroflexi bacterium RBG_16_51_16]